MPHKNILRKIDAAALIENATNPRPGKRSTIQQEQRHRGFRPA